MSYKSINRIIYDSINRFSTTYLAIILISIWAFFEASIWFVIPDFLILILIIVNPKYYKKFFLITFVSSIIGIICYYVFVYFNTNLAYQVLIKTPFTNSLMVESISNLYQKGYAIEILKQAYLGIPSKVWTFVAVNSDFSFFQYLSLVTVSRGVRIFLVSLVTSMVATRYKDFIRNNFILLFLVYVTLFFTILSIIS